MITFLESVVISNNQVVFDGETAWNEVTDRGCLAILDTEVRLNQTKYFNNSLSAIYGQGSDLHFHGVNIVRNNTGVCGGALSLNQGSFMYVHPGTQIYITENTGLKYGGGICVDNGIVKRHIYPCFYQTMDPNILHNNNYTFVYMEGNRAAITGYSIFGGPVWKTCSHTTAAIFLVLGIFFIFLSPQNVYLDSWYEVSSEPVKVCFCAIKADLYAQVKI